MTETLRKTASSKNLKNSKEAQNIVPTSVAREAAEKGTVPGLPAAHTPTKKSVFQGQHTSNSIVVVLEILCGTLSSKDRWLRTLETQVEI